MEEGGLNMKSVHILLVLVIAASVLGCVGKKPSEITTPVAPVETPVQTAVSPAGTPAPSGDDFGTEGDISAIDSLVNDSSMDIPLSDATI
jgi:hypothetical protein